MLSNELTLNRSSLAEYFGDGRRPPVVRRRDGGALRILMLNYEYPPIGGGSGNATKNFLRELADHRGILVDLITSSASDKIEVEHPADTIKILRLPVGKREPHFWTICELARWTRQAMVTARQLTQEQPYDLCHCWSGWPSGLIGYQLRHRLPYLVALRGSDVPGYNTRTRWLDPFVFAPLSRKVWGDAAAITCVSHGQLALARNTASDLHFDVICNGSNTRKFRPAEVSPRFDALFVGRLIQRKGVIHLLRAAAALCKTSPSFELGIVGSGPQHLALERFSQHEGIDNRVSFLGAVDHNALPDIYAGARVFVMPALEEAMPNAVLEAMASGLPIVTTDTGGAELLDGNGVVVGRGDETAMENALQRYLQSPELCLSHGKRSRELAEKNSWGATVDAYIALYDRILTAGRDRY